MTTEQAAAMLVHVPEVQAIEVASLNPGDVVVINVDGYVSSEMTERVTTYLQPIFPHNKIVVLERGATLKVVRS